MSVIKSALKRDTKASYDVPPPELPCAPPLTPGKVVELV